MARIREEREREVQPRFPQDHEQRRDVASVAHPRWSPTATQCRGASQGPGVPPPAAAKSQRHRDRATPSAIAATAGDAVGEAALSNRERTHRGSRTAPETGTTRVNRRFAKGEAQPRGGPVHGRVDGGTFQRSLNPWEVIRISAAKRQRTFSRQTIIVSSTSCNARRAQSRALARLV